MFRTPGGDPVRPSHRGRTPLANARLGIATQFFRRHAIPADFVDKIDFSCEVREIALNPGFHLVAFRSGPLPGAGSWNPFGLFYTEVGISPSEIAIKPDTRMLSRYIVVKAVRALRFRASPIGAATGRGPTYLHGGQGWQYIIPAARASLRRI